MNEEIKKYLDKYPEEVATLFYRLRDIILYSTDKEITETMWAKLPSYYVGEAFARLIPFKDHINIEAAGIAEYKDELPGYKITPKGMLQIFIGQAVPEDALKSIFTRTLG